MNEKKGDGAFLIRFGSKRTFVLSIKYTGRDKEVKIADYQIKRTNSELYK